MHIVYTTTIGLLKANEAVAASDSTDTHKVSKPKAELSGPASNPHAKYDADRRHSLEALGPGRPNRGAGCLLSSDTTIGDGIWRNSGIFIFLCSSTSMLCGIGFLDISQIIQSLIGNDRRRRGLR